MASDTRLIHVYIPPTKNIIQIRRHDFRKYKGTILPSYEVLFDGIARQMKTENNPQDESAPEALLIYVFLSLRDNLPSCFAAQRKRFNPDVHPSFEQACQYPG